MEIFNLYSGIIGYLTTAAMMMPASVKRNLRDS
jgi:hypothetical protein